MTEDKRSGLELETALDSAIEKYLEHCGWTLERDGQGFSKWVDPITNVPHYSIVACLLQYDRNTVKSGFKFPQRPMRATPEHTTPCSVDDLRNDS